MNEERLLAVEASAQMTVGHVRGFLYNMVGLAKLFDGCGYVMAVSFRADHVWHVQVFTQAGVWGWCSGGRKSKRQGGVWCASTSAAATSQWNGSLTLSTWT